MYAAPVATSISARPRIVSYLRLGKARMYHYLYGWALGLLLLRSEGFLSGASREDMLVLACVLVGTLAAQWSAAAADDITGYLNGSDAHNYRGRPPVTMARKPLITGELSLPQAVGFALVTGIVGVFAVPAVAGILGWRVPAPAIVVALVVPALAVQYSCGIKLSYRPLGLESVILVTGAYTVIMPYWFVAGAISRETLLVGALFGLWLLVVVSYGNASDRSGDAAVGRRTLAVVLPPLWFAVGLHALVAVHAVLLAVLFGTTSLRPGSLVFAAPVVIMHLIQLWYGVYKERLRTARFLVLLSIDLGSAGLAAALIVGSPS
ncbi:UbiA family prenyltransferase [Streptomyces sp. NPDC048603]|uniref:UbiA family prenyltransferase n=1 Tax=Streptomyces sp. NPDC048603 TaxID=3365577 RepID=UPI00371302E4